MKYNLLIVFYFVVCFSFSQRVQIISPSQLKDTNIKTLKVITNKEEFSKHFSDSLSYKTLMPYVQIPQTNVWIAPPKNFKLSENIRGFIHLATTTSIVCTEIKGFHFTTVVANLTDEKIAQQNALLKSVEDVTTSSGMPAKLVTISFTLTAKNNQKESPFERLMLFTGDMENTIWLSATYPEAVKPFVFEMVKKSLLSVKFDQP